MSKRLTGGYLTIPPTWSADSCPGVWTPEQQFDRERTSVWPSSGDSYWSSVSLLLHMDGSNNSTTFTDSSANVFSITAFGDAKISTTQSKFGGSSGAFDGTGDYISTPANSAFAFGTGDFTVELWLYVNALSGYKTLIGTRPTTSQFSDAWSIDYDGGGSLYGYSDNLIANSPGALSTGAWAHIAFTRASGVCRMFKDGTLTGSQANTQNFTRNTLYVGAAGNGDGATNVYTDEVRITKGVARYTSSFTAPTSPFPDFG